MLLTRKLIMYIELNYIDFIGEVFHYFNVQLLQLEKTFETQIVSFLSVANSKLMD